MVHHSNDDAMNKIPLKSASGLDDEEKNGGELMQDTAAAEEARREQMHANVLAWMKKFTIGFICFIGIALILYVIISLCFSDWPKSTPLRTNSSNIAATTMGTGTATITTLATTAATATEAVAAVTSPTVIISTPPTTTTAPSDPNTTVSSTVDQPLPMWRMAENTNNSTTSYRKSTNRRRRNS